MSEETLEIIIEALIDYRMWFKHEEEDDELSKIKLRQIEKALREIKKLKQLIMWHEVLHFLGLCGEPHPSVLTSAGAGIPVVSFIIYKFKQLKHGKK